MSVDMDTLGLRAAENAAEMAFIGVSQTCSFYLQHAAYALDMLTSAARKCHVSTFLNLTPVLTGFCRGHWQFPKMKPCGSSLTAS